VKKIEEIKNISVEEFHHEIVPAGKPIVIRDLVKDWPIVTEGKKGNYAFCEYIKKFDIGLNVNTIYGDPSINGRVFYNHDLTGLNCSLGQHNVLDSLNYLQEHANDNQAPTIALQSVAIDRHFPGMQNENPLFLLDKNINPRIWIGSKVIVAAHYDPSENIACCVTGRRRFTLLPPEEVGNLYVGPLEYTPAGSPISMVDFEKPDFEQYPKFKQALSAALQTELNPGDAIFIPYLWWHHVQSLEGINALVNYWWNHADSKRDEPRNALFHSMLSIRDLPPHQRQAWHALFEHYVFEKNGSAAAHLPLNRQGILGEISDDYIKTIRLALSKSLNHLP